MDVMIPLDREAKTPLSQQVYRELRRAIAGSRLPGGSRLPSTRELARQLGVARFTVDEAYAWLTAEGYIVGRRGSGTYVAEGLARGVPEPGEPRPAPGRQLSAWLRRLPTSASEVLPARIDSSAISFMTGFPALEEFPWTVWQRLLGREARNQSHAHRTYSNPSGLTSLREEIAGYLARSRGLRCSADQVVITSGVQQSMDVTIRMLVDPGDRVAIEDPSYHRVRRLLDAAGAEIIPLPVDADGLSPHALPRGGAPPKLVYTTPSHQFPSGAILPLERRLELLAWSGETGTVIVEDDYDGELRYGARPVPALAGLARERHGPNNVIYTGSFSKVLFPALRLGYAVVPQDLVVPYQLARMAIDWHPPTLLQSTVTAMIREGHFERHLVRMRRLYASRHTATIEAIERHLAGVVTIDSASASAGLHLLVRVESDRPEAEIVQRAADHGVLVAGASPCYISPPAEPRLLIGFSGTPTDQIDEGIARLAHAIRM
jgi:GntR family transcriptional regulator/MocR family aminotransferase